MRPRVVLVSHGAALGGSPISALHVAEQLREEFNFRLIYGEEGPVATRTRAAAFEVHVLPKGRGLLRQIALVRRCMAVMDGADLVHLNTLTSYYKYAALAARIEGVPIVWFVRENPQEKRCLRLMPWLSRLADRVVTVSRDTAEHLSAVAPEKVEVIHNGVDLERFRPAPNDALRRDARVIFGIMASLEPRKRVIEAVEAFAGIEPTRFRLLIAGRDRYHGGRYEAQLRQRITERGLQDNVELVGEVQDAARFMNGIDVFMLLSSWEGLARTILEAMACGKPVIASPAGGNPEQVEAGVTGYLVPAERPERVAEAVRRYLNEPGLIHEHGKAARHRAERHFSLAENAARIKALYRDLTAD